MHTCPANVEPNLWAVKRAMKRSAPYIEEKDGGAEGIRTPDPHNAIVVLYQLSYDPIRSEQCRGSFPNVKTILPLFASIPENKKKPAVSGGL